MFSRFVSVTEPGLSVCDDAPDATFAKNEQAGISCNVGTLNDKDSDDGTTTGDQFLAGIGKWEPYTHGELEGYLRNWAKKDGLDEATQEELIDNGWAPKCCL
uniref:Uncharacterized protein n=1 Tax=Trieres chinensis TaxID=1514140 RepID=A0A7S1ZMD8_TRICV|mmetsp:Transcript_28900/g.59165  ORF Transcript_28900/g.59165 Transcript_28900/m.59165 type:complete len:102 (+) Transcript_28900:351-656(+)